jgi:proteasome lid subunit RPN8/RPN11
MLKISHSDYTAIRKHGEETYPHECCGVILGKMDDGVRIAKETVRCGNTRTDSPENRYNISPQELIAAQRKAREQGMDIVGFYHSHPDHPARWSTTDLNEAHWFACSYVITSIDKGIASRTHSFVLAGNDEESKRFEDENIEVG